MYLVPILSCLVSFWLFTVLGQSRFLGNYLPEQYPRWLCMTVDEIDPREARLFFYMTTEREGTVAFHFLFISFPWSF
jgi:hypothetical protein